MDGNDSNFNAFHDRVIKSYKKELPSGMDVSDEISFFEYSQHYCICYIDISESTKTTATIKDPQKIRDYYSTFLNSMAAVISEFHGKVIKRYLVMVSFTTFQVLVMWKMVLPSATSSSVDLL